MAEVFLDSGQKYFGEINEGRIGRMKCFCLIKIFDYNKHLQASCLTATGFLTLQITLTCRNMKVWSDAMIKTAQNNNNNNKIERWLGVRSENGSRKVVFSKRLPAFLRWNFFTKLTPMNCVSQEICLMVWLMVWGPIIMRTETSYSEVRAGVIFCPIRGCLAFHYPIRSQMFLGEWNHGEFKRGKLLSLGIYLRLLHKLKYGRVQIHMIFFFAIMVRLKKFSLISVEAGSVLHDYVPWIK